MAIQQSGTFGAPGSHLAFEGVSASLGAAFASVVGFLRAIPSVAQQAREVSAMLEAAENCRSTNAEVSEDLYQQAIRRMRHR